MPKLPLPPVPDRLVELGLHEGDVVAVAPHTVLWRVHATTGAHVLPWNRLRGFGPVPAGRFDPHPEPAGDTADEGVLYLAVDIVTALAEVYQVTRLVSRRRGSPYLTGLRLTRTVHLLDLSGSWPTRAGASQAISAGRRDRSRAWARAVRAAFPDLDGLWYPSSMHAGQPCVALWTPGADALPADPELSLALAHPVLSEPLAQACDEIGYRLL